MKVEIYTKDNCIYCAKAKELLKLKDQPFQEFQVGVAGITRETIQSRVGTTPEIRTVPQIFLDGVHLGGFDRLQEYYAKAK